jgi:hypothetical protein
MKNVLIGDGAEMAETGGSNPKQGGQQIAK